MKLVRKLLLTLIVLIVLIAGLFFGGVMYLNKKYDIDTFSTFSTMKKLQMPVEESEVVKNPYSEKDLLSTKTKFSLSYDGFLKEESDGLSFHPDAIQNGVRSDIYLTDRELACLLEEAVKAEMDSKIDIGGYLFSFSVRSLSIKVEDEKTSVLSFVCLIDISDLRKAFTGLAGMVFGRYVPKFFYLTISFENIHGEEAFSYSVKPEGLVLNTLTVEESASLFTTIGKFVSFPEADKVTEAFSTCFMDNLIGTESDKGLLYSMKPYGVRDYSFVNYNNENCFCIEA